MLYKHFSLDHRGYTEYGCLPSASAFSQSAAFPARPLAAATQCSESLSGVTLWTRHARLHSSSPGRTEYARLALKGEYFLQLDHLCAPASSSSICNSKRFPWTQLLRKYELIWRGRTDVDLDIVTLLINKPNAPVLIELRSRSA